MMKSFLCLVAFCALLAFVPQGYGEEVPVESIRSRDGLFLNLNLYNMHNTANPFGPTYTNTYFEVEGGGRSGILDFYFFFDVNEIFGWGDQHNEAGQFFTKIKPRLSLNGISGWDLSLGPVQEWYVATQYKGFNGGEYYYAGLGVDLEIPGIDSLAFNFWPQFLRDREGADFEYTGLEVSLNWFTVLCQLPWESNLSYQGWLDWGFLNTYDQKEPDGTQDEFQMFNGFFLNHGHYSLSFSVKFHRHLTYHDSGNSDATTWFLGAHYHF